MDALYQSNSMLPGGPLASPGQWDVFSINGVVSPGVIPAGGIRGFKREFTWDMKIGKGTVGGTPSLTQRPLVKGSFVLQFWNDQQIKVNWPGFVALMNYNPDKSSSPTALQALTLYHPALSAIQLNLAICEYITPVIHKGQNLYEVEIGFVEYVQPSPNPVNATQTPKGAAAANQETFGPPVTAASNEVREAILQGQIAANAWSGTALDVLKVPLRQ